MVSHRDGQVYSRAHAVCPHGWRCGSRLTPLDSEGEIVPEEGGVACSRSADRSHGYSSRMGMAFDICTGPKGMGYSRSQSCALAESFRELAYEWDGLEKNGGKEQGTTYKGTGIQYELLAKTRFAMSRTIRAKILLIRGQNTRFSMPGGTSCKE